MNPSTRRYVTRRSVLRTGLSVSAATIIAGCTGSEEDNKGDGTTPSGTTEAGDADGGTDTADNPDKNTSTSDPDQVDTAYDSWVATANSLGFDYPNFNYTSVIKPEAIYGHRDKFPCEIQIDDLQVSFPVAQEALGVDAVNMIVRMKSPVGPDPHGVWVATGTFDLGSVLESEDWKQLRTHEGFTLYQQYEAGASVNEILAVADGVAVYSNAGNSIEEVTASVEGAIDVDRQGTGRLVDEDDHIRQLLGELGSGDVVAFGPVSKDNRRYDRGWRGLGSVLDLGSSETESKVAVSFNSESQVSTEAVNGLAAREAEPLDSSTYTSGRVAVFEAIYNTDHVVDGLLKFERKPPSVSVKVEYDAGSEVLTVTHNGGEPLEGGFLRVEFPGGSTEQRIEDAFQVGEDIDFDVGSLSSGETVRIIWRQRCDPDGHEIGRYTVP